ncbi:hypothetical protein [Kitasatospora sp. NPDC005748]|uniref:hypothetical protein n=1 Tax=Kitasatospora sp. NPDC005748 TaxID=3157063 RepID=UPI0033DA94D3
MRDADDLAAAIDRLPDTDGPLTVGLRAVEYLDRTGLTVLFARAHRIRLIAGGPSPSPAARATADHRG